MFELLNCGFDNHYSYRNELMKIEEFSDFLEHCHLI